MNCSRQITVLVADDHDIVREGICALLNADGHFVVVGQARTGRDAVERARSLRPDVILMDVDMPILNGSEATRQILAGNSSARVLVLSGHSDDGYLERMYEAGVAGYIEKQTAGEILIKAIREIAKGNTFFSPAIVQRMRGRSNIPPGRNGLIKAIGRRPTPRESEVLQLVAEGFSNKQMAAELAISIKTIEKHRQHLMDKLNVHDTAGLTRYAIAAGVIESTILLTST